MKNFYLLCLTLLMGGSLLAQKRITLQWRVVNDKNEPLEYATIINKNTNQGVLSDQNGRFSIEVVEEQDELIISYIGYETSTIPIKKGIKSSGTEMLFPGDFWCCIENQHKENLHKGKKRGHKGHKVRH